MRLRLARTGVMPVVALLSACRTPMSIFTSASEPAAAVARLTWFMIVLGTVVYGTVILLIVIALRRNQSRAADAVDLSSHGDGWIIAGGVVTPAVILGALFMVSLGAMGRAKHATPALTIGVVGRQWWWQLRYNPGNAAAQFETANELHIPVGKQVRLLLTSADVIHSFWVPQLQGKLDVIPGDTNDLRLSATATGVYRGKCAEFCGAQHTNMAIVVVVDDSLTFARWQERQQLDAPSTPSTDSIIQRGARLFASTPCAGCHSVRGTTAIGKFGPDLTHVGSRLTIGAGVLPMQFGSLSGWIANAPAVKPGVFMPMLTGFSGSDLQAITSYVSSLR